MLLETFKYITIHASNLGELCIDIFVVEKDISSHAWHHL